MVKLQALAKRQKRVTRKDKGEKVPQGVSASWDDVRERILKDKKLRSHLVRGQEGQELNVSSKYKVKNARLNVKKTFMAGGIRRSGKAVFGES